jgi:hypothetical protein
VRVDAQSTCRPADEKSAVLISWLGMKSTATKGDDLLARTYLKLPLVAANELSLVTQDDTCMKARPAYEVVANAEGGTGLSGKLWVVKVGEVFAVVDPGYHWGPEPGAWKLVVMDSTYKTLMETTLPTTR